LYLPKLKEAAEMIHTLHNFPNGSELRE